MVDQSEVAEIEALVLAFVLPDEFADIVERLEIKANGESNEARPVDLLVEAVDVFEPNVVAVSADVDEESERSLHFVHGDHRGDAAQRRRVCQRGWRTCWKRRDCVGWLGRKARLAIDRVEIVGSSTRTRERLGRR